MNILHLVSSLKTTWIMDTDRTTRHNTNTATGNLVKQVVKTRTHAHMHTHIYIYIHTSSKGGSSVNSSVRESASESSTSGAVSESESARSLCSISHTTKDSGLGETSPPCPPRK